MVFKRCFPEVFLLQVWKTASRSVALVTDNFVLHGPDVSDSRGQVTSFPLSAKCTSTHQSMDLGIIAKWKIIYRCNLLVKIMDDEENVQALRDENKTKAACIKGLAEIYDPHMLGVTKNYGKEPG